MKTELLWDDVFVKVLLNEVRGVAIPFDGYEFAVCESHDEILHDKDAQVHLDHFIMKACCGMYVQTPEGEDEECDFSSYASTTCVRENLEDLERSCRDLGVSSWVDASDALRVTYLRGELRMFRYDREGDVVG